MDSVFDAPYFSGRLRRSSVPSEAAGEGMTSYLLLSTLSSHKCPKRTGLSRFESVIASNPNVKATVSEAIIHIYYWFGYEVGVYIGAIGQGLDLRELTLLASVRLGLEQQRCLRRVPCISNELFVLCGASSRLLGHFFVYDLVEIKLLRLSLRHCVSG